MSHPILTFSGKGDVVNIPQVGAARSGDTGQVKTSGLAPERVLFSV